jgi:hypothetical protein
MLIQKQNTHSRGHCRGLDAVRSSNFDNSRLRSPSNSQRNLIDFVPYQRGGRGSAGRGKGVSRGDKREAGSGRSRFQNKENRTDKKQQFGKQSRLNPDAKPFISQQSRLNPHAELFISEQSNKTPARPQQQQCPPFGGNTSQSCRQQQARKRAYTEDVQSDGLETAPSRKKQHTTNMNLNPYAILFEPPVENKENKSKPTTFAVSEKKQDETLNSFALFYSR